MREGGRRGGRRRKKEGTRRCFVSAAEGRGKKGREKRGGEGKKEEGTKGGTPSAIWGFT